MWEFEIRNGILERYRGRGGEVAVPDGVTEISSCVFGSCEDLTGVTLPAGVTKIGYMAFNSCARLTRVTLPNGLTVIGDWAFTDCVCLTDVALPDGLTSIGANAFGDCEALTEISLPDSLTSIGKDAFSGCCALKRVAIPAAVTAIGDGAFDRCLRLAELRVDENNPAFCSDDRGVLFSRDKRVLLRAPQAIRGGYTIPDGVTALGKNAFLGCELRWLAIPASVTDIGQDALDCYPLTRYRVAEGSAGEQYCIQYDAFYEYLPEND